jgi:hypothetical protein
VTHQWQVREAAPNLQTTPVKMSCLVRAISHISAGGDARVLSNDGSINRGKPLQICNINYKWKMRIW